MSNVTYVARDIFKFSEQDDYEQGCLPGTGQAYNLNLSFSGNTPDDVIKKIAEFLDVDKDGIERNACDEDADNATPSKSQIEQWKRGNLKLWYVVYSAQIEKCEPVRV